MQSHKVGAHANRGNSVERHEDIRYRIVDFVVRLPECELEDIVHECADLTWNQVFLEVDRLSRLGLVVLRQKGPGHCSVVWAKGITPTIH